MATKAMASVMRSIGSPLSIAPIVAATSQGSKHVLTEREERNSIAIASNQSFSGWTDTFTDPACAPPSWTDSPTTAPSSKPAPTPTAWPTPARRAGNSE
jgi:hypothetical protein